MFEYAIEEGGPLRVLLLKGRVDALSSAEMKKVFDRLILAGERTILVDFAGVNYVSSAGLRLFLQTQKELRTVGGEIVLFGFSPEVLEVFRISGLDRLFRIVSARNEFISTIETEASCSAVVATEGGEIAMEYKEFPSEKGSLFVVGSEEPLIRAGYTEKDVIRVKPMEMMFGCGLGTLGETYEDYKDLFGECMVVHRNFFFFPAVKRSEVDYMVAPQGEVKLTYKFFHGFGFNGPYRFLLSFESRGDFSELSVLVKALFKVSKANVLGISFIAESKGIWGMHLKEVPIAERRPGNGKGIFDPSNFRSWIDFPVEPADVDHIVAGTGIVIREKDLAPPEIQALLSEGNSFHIHAGVFGKGPLSKLLKDYEKELARVLTELEVYKVQHLLGRSRFGSGMVGIVELQEP